MIFNNNHVLLLLKHVIAKPGIVTLLKLGIKMNKYKGDFSLNIL